MSLADCFLPLFVWTARLPGRVGEEVSFEELREKAAALISASNEERKRLGAPKEEYEYALLAVLAWTDEKIVGLDWQDARRWFKSPLQRVYCDTRQGGELFFERLELIAPEQRELREVFVICLLLGFKGRFNKEKDWTVLDQLKKRHLRMLGGEIPRLEAMLKGPLFPDAEPPENHTVEKSRPLWLRLAANGTFWFWTISLLAAGGCWLFFFLKLKDMASV